MHCFKDFVNEAYFGVNASKNTRLPARAPMRATPMTAAPVAAMAPARAPSITLQAPNIFNAPAPMTAASVAATPQNQPPAPAVAPAVTQKNLPTTTLPGIAPSQPAVAKAAPVTGKNGRLQLAQLTQVETGHYLAPAAASKFEQMKTAAAADGINLNINNAYRSYEKQVEMANRLGLYSRGGKAAVPGTSNHGWGKAVDLNVKSNPGSFEWLKQNAAKYGFKNIPREPWHWELA